MMRWLTLVVVAAPLVVAAEPVAPEAEVPPSNHEPTAADVEGAPPPGQESGRIDHEDDEGSLRKVGRGILVVPRVAVELVFTPVRASVYAVERYHLKERLAHLLFDETVTYGVYPVATIDSQYGLNVGAKFLHRDLFGERERLRLHAGTGGRFQQIFSAKLSTGRRLGDRVRLELGGEFEKRPKDAFFGIGDDSMALPSIVADMPVAEARFRQRVERVSVIGEVRATRYLHLRGSGAITDFDFGTSEHGAPINELYPVEMMVGFDGVRQAYTELEVRWDSRRRASQWEPPAVRAAGSLLAGFAGRVHALDDGSDYWRYGVDLQHFVRIGAGPRVLSGRLYGEAVSDGLDEVPFSQLPRLGGQRLLRGYPLDRFRDRVAAFGSVEYSWDLSRHVSASTFVDAGRVYSSLSDISVDDLRVGYGVGLELHAERSFIARASLASSKDGGIFFDLAFDPVFDQDPRVERR